VHYALRLALVPCVRSILAGPQRKTPDLRRGQHQAVAYPRHSLPSTEPADEVAKFQSGRWPGLSVCRTAEVNGLLLFGLVGRV
jgi:hypothetical protein